MPNPKPKEGPRPSPAKEDSQETPTPEADASHQEESNPAPPPQPPPPYGPSVFSDTPGFHSVRYEGIGIENRVPMELPALCSGDPPVLN